MMYITVMLSLVTGVITLYYLLTNLIPLGVHRMSGIPGPRIWPIIGNWHFLDRSSPLIKTWHMARKYGPVMRIQLGFLPVVMLNSYEAIYDGFVTQGKKLMTRPPIPRIEMAVPGFKDTLLGPATDQWKILRRAFMHNFKFYGSGKSHLEPIILQSLQDFIIKLKRTNGAAFDPKPMIIRHFQETMFAINFGKKPDDENDYKLNEIFIEDAAKYFNLFGNGIELDVFPGYKELGFGKGTRKVLETVAENGRKLWETYGRGTGVNPESDVFTFEEGRIHEPHFAATLKSLVSANADKGFDEQYAIGTMMDTFFGGVGNPVTMLYFFLNILQHYPKVQDKIHEEIDGVLGSNPDASITADFKTDLHYLRASLYELLRYLTSLPFALPHMTTEDVIIEGHLIPKGIPVLMNIWYLHHDDTFWEEPFKFKPERFLDESGRFISAEHPNRKHLLVFGAGQKVCTGKIFALNRLFITFANILLHFNIEPESVNELVSCDPRDGVPGLVTHGMRYKARFISRK